MYGQDIPIPILPIEALKAAAAKQQAPAPPMSPLAAMAAKMPPPKQPGVQSVTLSGPAEGSIVWNPGKTHWREKNSPNWRPASEYGNTKPTATTKVVK